VNIINFSPIITEFSHSKLKFPGTQTLRMTLDWRHIPPNKHKFSDFGVGQWKLELWFWMCSPKVVTEVTGRCMICGAGLCSMQGSVVLRGVTGSVHAVFCVHIVIYIRIYIYVYIYIHTYIYIYTHTGCNRRNVPYFGRVFLMLNYKEKTQNTYIQSWTVTEIMAIEKTGLLWLSHTVSCQLTVQMNARPSIRYYVTY
jgi:hypothetical protein